MKKVFTLTAIILLTHQMFVGCGSSGVRDKKEDRARAESESVRIKALSIRVAKLDSTITEFNKTVNEDLQQDLIYIDTCYLKMLHGDKFEDKYKEVSNQVNEKEVTVNTFIRATMINHQE